MVAKGRQMNNRRKLILALCAWALTPFAYPQRQKVWRIGFLWEAPPSADLPRLDAFKTGMSELGYVERRDYVVE